MLSTMRGTEWQCTTVSQPKSLVLLGITVQSQAISAVREAHWPFFTTKGIASANMHLTAKTSQPVSKKQSLRTRTLSLTKQTWGAKKPLHNETHEHIFPGLPREFLSILLVFFPLPHNETRWKTNEKKTLWPRPVPGQSQPNMYVYHRNSGELQDCNCSCNCKSQTDNIQL